MYYGNDEEKRVRIKGYIKGLKECAESIAHARKIIHDLDGKVLNVRLTRALNETGRHYNYEIRNHHLSIIYYPTSRAIVSKIIAFVDLPYTESSKAQRIPGQMLIKSLNEYYAAINREAAQLEEALESIDTTREMIRQAVKQFNILVDKIPYEIIDTYNIPRKIYTHF